MFACLFVFSVRNRVWKNRLEAMPSAQAVPSPQSHLMWLSGLALLAVYERLSAATSQHNSGCQPHNPVQWSSVIYLSHHFWSNFFGIGRKTVPLMGPRSNLAGVVFITSPVHFLFEEMGSIVKHWAGLGRQVSHLRPV